VRFLYKSIRDTTFQIQDKMRIGCWVDVPNAGIRELKTLSKAFAIELDDLKDSLDVYEMMRVERYHNHVFLFVRYPVDSRRTGYTGIFTMVLTKEVIITISPFTAPIFQDIYENNAPLTTTQKSKFVLQTLLRIVQSYTKWVKRVQSDVFKSRVDADSISSEDILALTKSEEILHHYQAALVPFRNTLGHLSSGKFIDLYEEDRDLLNDLLLAIQQCEEICSVNLKSIRGLRDCYQTIFTNNVNKTMKLLTAFTIIFMIPTLISSMYGMNVELPFASRPHAFLEILSMSFVFSFCGFLLFYWRRWL